MGCSPSSSATGEQPSSKNSKETNKQPKKNAPAATVSTTSQRESDSSYEERSPSVITVTLPSPEETNTGQNTGIRSGLTKKPMGLAGREKKSSADILTELRTQGIIKMTSGMSQNRQGEDTMLLATGRPPQKPPAKLEKA
ncbi:stathmin domain-containing protein 1 [Sphaerodactylus townsendi]|uniref:stathmin domain-containing protein 1 n=1 Tax=Sphaerodactylus townsendi TaxID=933632 RepID=UPI002026DB40|nr:stathmin domain-containing protein 1 [Sphaerodactylus townsendi]